VPSVEELTFRAANLPNPTLIARANRLENPQARAAFSLAMWSSVDFAPNQCPCNRCGALTAAFCDSCYFRARPANPPPFPICSMCDAVRLVCRVCEIAGCTWEMSQQQFQQEFPAAAAGKAVVMYGLQGPRGFIRLDHAMQVSLPPGWEDELHF
jgi:hypothetical protein